MPARNLSPQQALDHLMEGNKRFVADTPSHPNQNSKHRSTLTDHQHPYATLFGCADSRVAAEMIFDVGLGEMFVVRTAGQVTDAVTIGSLEYGASNLGTPLLIVLGHDSCGAVTAAVESLETGETPNGFVYDVVSRLLPTVIHARRDGFNDIGGAVHQNTVDTVHLLYERSQILKELVDSGQLMIVGMTYKLKDGRGKIVAQIGGEAATEKELTEAAQ